MLTAAVPPDRKRLLIVEDQDSVRSLLKAVFARDALDVDEAQNGRDAIQKLESSRFDTVILDLMMPVVSGYRVLEYLKAEQPSVKCIVVSAAGEIGLASIDPSLEVVKKPFDTADLRRRVLLTLDLPIDRL